MPTHALRSVLVLSCLISAALPVASASAETKVRTVDGELVFKNGQRPGDPGNCSAIVFVQWKDVPGTVRATASYMWRGAEYSETREAPFDDTFEWVATYTVPAGSHWIHVGKTWRDGPQASTCEDFTAKQQVDFTPPARVELTVEIDPKVCNAAKRKLAARKKAVGKARKRVRNATTRPQRNQLKAKLKKAKAKRTKASARVKKVC